VRYRPRTRGDGVTSPNPAAIMAEHAGHYPGCGAWLPECEPPCLPYQLAEALVAEQGKVTWVRDIARTAYRNSSRIDPYEVMRATLSDAEIASLAEYPDRNPFNDGAV
jgi:hypothetical protein